MKITLEEVSAFLAVVDTGSLTSAADHLHLPISNISRTLAKLESKLQTTLLRRTTRRIDLTDEGVNFVKDARKIVESVRIAEDRLMESRGRLSGPLRVNASSPVMLHLLVPLMGGYRAQHPDVQLCLSSNEGFIDLIERRVDLAIRVGELKDSTLHSRLLGHTRLRILASPGYLQKNGVPEDIQALKHHELLGFSQPEILNLWPLQHAGGNALQITPTLSASSGETLRQLALQGNGIVCLSEFMTHRDVEEGRLVEVLYSLTNTMTRPVNAVYYQQSAVSTRIASMVKYLAEALSAPESRWSHPIV